jgi:sugar lactone lactonase YvrE
MSGAFTFTRDASNALVIERSAPFPERVLKEGETVSSSEPIAPVGETGGVTGPHVHVALGSLSTKPNADFGDNPLHLIDHLSGPFEFDLTQANPPKAGPADPVIYSTSSPHFFPFVADVNMSNSRDLDKVNIRIDDTLLGGPTTFVLSGVPGESPTPLILSSSSFGTGVARSTHGIDPINIGGEIFRRQFVYLYDISTMSEGAHTLAFTAKSADGLTETTTSYAFLVNSKLPFVKKAKVESSSGTIVYEASWNLSGANYDLATATQAGIREPGDYDVTLEFSEPAENVSVHFSSAGPVAMTASDTAKTIWQGTLTLGEGETALNGPNVMMVTASDLAGTALAALSAATGSSFPATELARDANGNFTGPQGADTRHSIAIHLPVVSTTVAAEQSPVTIALKSSNQAGVAYVSAVNSGVRVQEINGGALALGSNAYYGTTVRDAPAFAYSPQDRAGLAYPFFNGATGKLELRYDGQTESGTTTSEMVVDDNIVQGDAALGFGADGKPRVAYQALQFNPSSGFDEMVVKYARWDGSQWLKTILEPPPLISNISNVAITVNAAAGQTHVAYTAWDLFLNFMNFTLVTLDEQGQVIDRRTVEPAADPDGSEIVGYVSDLRIDTNGNLHGAYLHVGFNDTAVKYFKNSAIETVDAVYDHGNVAVALDGTGKPFVAYSGEDPATGENRMYIRRQETAGVWMPETALTVSTTLRDMDMAIGSDAALQVAYLEQAQGGGYEIRWAKRSLRHIAVSSGTPAAVAVNTTASGLTVAGGALTPGQTAALATQHLGMVGDAYVVGAPGETPPPGETFHVRYPEAGDPALEGQYLVYNYAEDVWTPLAGQSVNAELNVIETSEGARGPVAVLRPKALETPLNFAGLALSTGSVAWSWTDAATTEDGYRVLDAAGANVSGDLPADAVGFVETGLPPNTRARRRAAGFNAFGEEPSLFHEATTRAAAPAGLTAEGVAGPLEGETLAPGISLAWDANGNPFDTSYAVERSLDGSEFAATGPPAVALEFADFGLVEGTTAHYRVRAFNHEGVATTYSATAVATVPRVPPSGITDLAVSTGAAEGELVLAWTAPGDDEMDGQATAYDLRLSTTALDEANFLQAVQALEQMVPAPSGQQEVYSLTGLTGGVTYYVALRAQDDAGNFGAPAFAGQYLSRPDTDAPLLRAFDFGPRIIDTNFSSRTVAVSARLTDDVSGVAAASVTFRSPSGAQSSLAALALSTGTALDGYYVGAAAFPQFSEQGTWSASVTAADALGRSRTLEPADLSFQGLPSALEVDPVADARPPELVSFDFSPKTVDVTTGPQTVTFSVAARDNLSGVSYSLVLAQSQSGQFASVTATRLAAGTPQDGTFEGDLTFQPFISSGAWVVSELHVVDQIGNAAVFSTADLAARGFPTTIQVISIQDTTPPELVSFDFNPKTVDVTAGPQTVTFTLGARDDLSGVSYSLILAEAETGRLAQAVADRMVSGTPLDGVFEGTMNFVPHVTSGTWIVREIHLTPVAGPGAVFTTAGLAARGFPVGIEVISIPDVTPPELTSFDFTPKAVDATFGARLVTFDVGMRDDLSGILYSIVLVGSEGGRTLSAFSQQLISGTETEGVLRGSVQFEQFSETGTWTVADLTIADSLSNTATFLTADLAARGFPTRVLVGPGATLPGELVQVSPLPSVTVTFDTVTASGFTTVTPSFSQTPVPANFALVNAVLGDATTTYFDVATTAQREGEVRICVGYSDAGLTGEQEAGLRLLHDANGAYEDVTDPGSPDTAANLICGTADSLSVFVVALPLDEPPLASLISPSPDAAGVCRVFSPGPIPLRGLVEDENLLEYKVAVATAGGAEEPGTGPFTEIIASPPPAPSPVEGEGTALGSWDTSGLGGWFTVKLTARDEFNNTASTAVNVYIGEPVRTLAIGKNQPVDFRLGQPKGVAVDPSGNIYVGEKHDGRIRKFDPAGGLLATLGEAADIGNPTGLAVDATGNIWVADRRKHQVLKLDAAGNLLRRLGKSGDDGKPARGSGPGEFHEPTGAAVDAAGNVYVADRKNGRVQKFSSSGEFLSEFDLDGPAGLAGTHQCDSEDGDDGSPGNRHARPWGIAVGAGGLIWVSDDRHARVLELGPDGTLLRTVGQRGRSEGAFRRPKGIAVTPQGYLFVSDMDNHRIQKFDPALNLVLVFGEKDKHALLSFKKPFGVAAGTDGKLYVTDRERETLQVFDAPGTNPPAGTSPTVNGPVAALAVPTPAGADPTFRLDEVYSYPNPARSGARPVIHVECGLADGAEIRVYDLAGDLVHEASIAGPPPVVNDGQGPQYAFEYPWDVSNAASGVYLYTVAVHKNGSDSLRKTGKLAVVK